MVEGVKLNKDDEIILKEEFWQYECGEPMCCYESGYNLYVNDNLITDCFDGDIEDIKSILILLGFTNVVIEGEF